MARNATAPEKVLLAGVGRESVIETLRLAEYAAQVEYDAILVRTPHYYRKQMRNREMLTYYQAVADRSPLPVLLYSVPSCTAYDLPIEVVAELAMHPNIVGMKDSSGNVERIAELVKATRSAKKRTVTVTPVFAAVTSRMLSPKAVQQEGNAGATFVAAGQLVSGATALAERTTPASTEDPYQGSGLPVALRFRSDVLPVARSRGHRGCSRARKLCSTSVL